MDKASLDYLVSIAFYATISLGIIAAGATIIAVVAFNKGQARTFGLLIQKAEVLQLVTVLTIVVGACLLAVIGKINSEGIVAILSGIAGYVLGGIKRGSERNVEIPDNTNSN